MVICLIRDRQITRMGTEYVEDSHPYSRRRERNGYRISVLGRVEEGRG